MSLDVTNLNLVPTVDPRINVQKLSKLLYGIESTGSDSLFNVVPLTTASINGINASINPSNNQVVVDRKVYLQMQFLLTFTGNSTVLGVPLLQCPGLPVSGVSNFPNAQYYDAPRAYGLSNTMSILTAQLNGTPITTNLRDYMRALTRYGNNHNCQDQITGYSPTMLDQSLNYDDMIAFNNRNPMAGYGDNYYQTPRGGFINAVVERNDATGLPGDIAVVRLTLMEPLFLSPLNTACREDLPGFVQLSSLQIIAKFSGRGSNNEGLISTLWSHNPTSPSTFSSFETLVIPGNCNLIYFQITPPLDYVIPKTIVYDYVEPYLSKTDKASVPAGSQVVGISLNSIQLNSIPERVYIWIDKKDPDYSMTDTDTYFSIEQLSITFNGKSGILGTATPDMLYNIAVRNKTNSNYRQFRRDVGSVLCLRFGEDIPLNTLLAPGSRGSYDFSATFSATNNYSVAVTPSISVLFIYAGTFTISNGRCLTNLGIITQNDVLSVKQSGQVPIPAVIPLNSLGGCSENMQGGFGWSDFTNFFKKIGRTAIDIGKEIVPALAPQYTPAIKAADVLARTIGFGSAVGGKKLSRQKMLKMLR